METPIKRALRRSRRRRAIDRAKKLNQREREVALAKGYPEPSEAEEIARILRAAKES